MIKQSWAIIAMATLLMASCKENAALSIDEDTAKKAEIAHADSGKIPVIKFAEPEFDFGTIKQGDKVEHTFKFTNEGTADLIISDAKASCGCTIPDWTKDPVAPGKDGEVKVVFNSAGKSGDVSKTVTLTLNTEKGTETVSFKANIKTDGIGTVPATH
jgi:Protein of unknown function (DUF1573)